MRKNMWKKWLSVSMAALVAAGSVAAMPVMEAKAGVTAPKAVTEEDMYVLMNIPYADFYAAETTNNAVKVDAFTSATKNKSRTGTETMAGGSYHVNSDGTDITGVTYPVKVPAGTDLSQYKQVTDADSVTIEVTNRGQTSSSVYNGKDALFENASYAYYVLDAEPAYYKELTVNEDETVSFGAAIDSDGRDQVEGVTADFMTESSYGDYELELSGLKETGAALETAIVYGVVIQTTDNTGYGLRHMENIWLKTDLAWCTGFVTSVHNCPTSSAHYESMMGKTIDKVVYYTSVGIVEADITDTYVPVKFSTDEITVAAADVSTGKAAVDTTGLPADYDAEYSVNGLQNASVANGELTFATSAKAGSYMLNISDKSGKYADVSVSFLLSTSILPVAYNSETVSLTGTDADEVANYIANITSVSVDGTAYAASGRNSVQIINEDGSIKTDAAPIAEVGSYEMEVSATGYPAMTFTYVKKADQTLTLSKTAYTVTYGAKAFNLGAAAQSAITYTSSNAKVAAVDANGNVSIKGAGTAVITVTAGDASYNTVTQNVSITVNKASQTISGVSSSYSLTYGKTKTITAKAAAGAITYTSNQSSVVSVNKTSGKMTAKKVGTAKITITAAGNSNYNKVSKTITVKVTKASQTIKVKTASKTYKKSTIKKASKSFQIGATAKTGISYSVTSGKKYISVSKAGKVTVKKNAAKGTYKIKAAAKATSNYKVATKTITVKVK